jgi:hypothetical protein
MVKASAVEQKHPVVTAQVIDAPLDRLAERPARIQRSMSASDSKFNVRRSFPFALQPSAIDVQKT